MPEKRTCSILVHSALAETNAPEDLVREILTTRAADGTVHPLTRIGVEFPPGLASRLCRELRKRNWKVSFKNRESPIDWWKERDEPPWELEDVEDRLLSVVVRKRRGQIVLSGGADAAMIDVVRRVFWLLPEPRMVLPVAGVEDGRRLAEQLRKAMPAYRGDIGFLCSRQPAKLQRLHRGKQIVVSTYASIPSERDILMLLRPEELATATCFDALQRWMADAPCHHVYALREEGWRPTRAEELAIEAVAGPIVSGPRPRRADVIAIQGPCTFPSRCVDVASKRDQIWRNPIRNRFIASLVAALASGNRRQWKRLGLAVASRRSLGLPRQGISIAVENTEHQRELAKRLPDADCLSLEAGSDDVFPTAPVQIVTLAYAAQYGFAPVVIRADGGIWDLARFCPMDGMLVVDLVDGAPARDAGFRIRRQAYTEAGWAAIICRGGRRRPKARTPRWMENIQREPAP